MKDEKTEAAVLVVKHMLALLESGEYEARQVQFQDTGGAQYTMFTVHIGKRLPEPPR